MRGTNGSGWLFIADRASRTRIWNDMPMSGWLYSASIQELLNCCPRDYEMKKMKVSSTTNSPVK